MQRPSTKQSRGINSAEKRHLVWIKERGICAACDNCNGVIAHHMYGSSFKHNKVLIGHWAIIGLCQQCDDIVTIGSRKRFTNMYGAQSELWLKQFNEYPDKDECPQEVIDAITGHGK